MVKSIPSLLSPICVVAAVASVALCGPATAQVTVDLHALDAQPGAGAPPPPENATPAHKPAPRRAPPRRSVVTKPVEKPATKPLDTKQAGPSAPTTAPAPPKTMAPAAQAPAPAASEPPAAVIGIAPPPIPVIPPPVAADAPMAPEAAPPISADAGTVVDTLPSQDGDGVRLEFKAGESNLTPSSADAVKALVAAAPKAGTTTFNVMAYAAGIPEDPSTARRLSLTRALSVRSALMAYGVPSTNIYVRALGAPVGAQLGDGPADRVDVLVLGANAVASPPGAATP